MKFAEHRMVMNLSPFIHKDCFVCTDNAESFGFLSEKLPDVVRGLVAFLKSRACASEHIQIEDARLHWTVSLHWRGFWMSEEEIEAAAAGAVTMTFMHMRYLSAYLRFTRVKQAGESALPRR